MDVDHQKVKLLRWATVVASLALSVYWAWTFTGPYALLVRLQLWAFGGYMGLLSWVIAWIALLIALHVVIGAMALRAGLPFHSVPLDDGRAAFRLNKFIFHHFGSVAGGLIIAGGVLSGGYFLIDGYRAGTLSEVSVEKLSAGEEPVSRYVDLIGQPLRTGEYMVGILGSALSRTGPGPDYYYSLSSDSLKMSHYLFFPKKRGEFRPYNIASHSIALAFSRTSPEKAGPATWNGDQGRGLSGQGRRTPGKRPPA